MVASVLAVRWLTDRELEQYASEARTSGNVCAKIVETGYQASRFPFESLRLLSQSDSFEFWWLVDGNQIVNANDAKQIGSGLDSQFSSLPEFDIEDVRRTQELMLYRRKLSFRNEQLEFWYGKSLAPIRNMQVRVTGITVLASIILFVFLGSTIYRSVKQITDPLGSLTHGIKRFGQGDLTHRIQVDGEGEIREMASAFNAMASEIGKVTDALSSSEKRYRATIDSMREIIFVTNQLGVITLTNNAFRRVVRQLGTNPDTEQLAQAFPSIYGKIRDLNLQESEADRFPITINCNGQTRIFEVVVVAMQKTDSDSGQLLVTMFDVTQKRRLEQEVLKVAKLETLSTFAGGIAHDMNNMLTTFELLLGLSQAKLVEDHGPDYDVLQQLDTAQSSLSRARDLSNRLLSFSRGESGERVSTRIDELARETINFALARTIINLHFHVADGLWKTEIDQTQITQVLQNLAINAIHAMPDDGSLYVSLENVEIKQATPALAVGSYVRVAIRDTGTGIAPENLDRIFDPFFSTKNDGTGLGLTSSFSIAQRHGGYLTADSAPGEGATFLLYLPAAAAARPETSDANAPRILLVDDDDLVRMTWSEIMEGLGYEVAAVSNGAEATKHVEFNLNRNRAFDVAILDLTINGFEGAEQILSELKAIQPNLKAIVSSGSIDHPAMRNPLEHGFDAILVKPTDIDTFSATVQRTLLGNRYEESKSHRATLQH